MRDAYASSRMRQVAFGRPKLHDFEDIAGSICFLQLRAYFDFIRHLISNVFPDEY